MVEPIISNSVLKLNQAIPKLYRSIFDIDFGVYQAVIAIESFITPVAL